MSAVSKNVMPASSAASTTARVRSKSSRPPKLLQPRPTRETVRGPSGTYSTKASGLEIFRDQAVHHAVHPLAVALVGLAADALPNEPGPLGVAQGSLVEAVDLELEPVVAQVEEEVALEEARRPVREPPAAEVGVDRQRAEVRDPAATVGDLEAHRAGAPPFALLLHLDQEAPELLRLRLRAVDLLQEPLSVARPDHGEEGLDLLVAHQLDQEVEVAGLGSPEPEPALVDHCGAGAGSRRRDAARTIPEPSATPARISTRPTSSSTVIGSPSSPAP